MHRRCELLALALLMFGVGSAGCDDDGEDVEQITERGGTSGCPAWRCGFNSAEVNGRSLRELNLAGLPNADKVKIAGFLPPPLALLGGYSLAVENDELVAKRSGSKLRGAQLVGSIILVQATDLGLPLPVTIAGYTTVPSWADGGEPIGAYTLVYPEVTALLGLKNVCSGSLLDPLASVATVLGGETYDPIKKEVVPNDGWFTLACAGSAAAKLKLLGYGPQSKFPGTTAPASVPARQATLKMLTADYCGKGVSYTENGTPVVWENHEGTADSSNWHTPGSVEAVWTDEGALCLDDPRIAGTIVECDDGPLPSCDGLDVSDGAWITHVAASG